MYLLCVFILRCDSWKCLCTSHQRQISTRARFLCQYTVFIPSFGLDVMRATPRPSLWQRARTLCTATRWRCPPDQVNESLNMSIRIHCPAWQTQIHVQVIIRKGFGFNIQTVYGHAPDKHRLIIQSLTIPIVINAKVSQYTQPASVAYCLLARRACQ